MEVVIDALVQTAISAVTNLLNEPKGYILNAKDGLEKLQMKLKKFQKDIKDADLKPFFSKERDRVLEAELKDVLYDAEDIMEEYRSKIEANKRDQVRKRSWTIPFTSFYENVSSRYQLGKKIKKINERLDKIKKDWDMVYRLKTTPKGGEENLVHGEHDNPRETTHHMGIQPPTGREDDKKVMVGKLLSDDSMTKNGSVSIISIVGKGGIGKTTLAKMVFSDIEQQFGKRRWWVCVSKRPNRKHLVRQILREVYKESGGNTDCSLSELCTKLQKELSMEKFLLDLDDVWELNWWEEEVGATLMAGAMGSKILITSRKKDVSGGMGAHYMHLLPEFSFHQSWELFIKEALGEGQAERDLEIHNVRDVGESIVKKCGGLPLVIKTVGSMMRTKQMSREDWKSVEDSEIWKWKRPAASSSSSEIGGDILPGLILSYDDLPYYLKGCFVYCCIYPKDYAIELGRLIMQWVAHGLIEEKKHIDVEVTANQYIEDLIRRCLVEEDNESFHGPRLKLHDLASYIGGEEYSHASTSQRTRHMSIVAIDNVKETMHNATSTTHKLRTLLTKSLPLVHLTNFKCLRVLSLRGCQMDELPKSVEDLALLKYLDLSYSNLRQLPSSIDRLYNLQTLDLSDSNIEELPKQMGELWNLTYLGLKRAHNLKFIAEGFGKLTNLRTLHRFLVCDDKEIAVYVNNCPALCEIASMPALEWLEVKDCGSLEQSPHHMPALKSLMVWGCDSLKALVNMPALESLEVSYCDSLEHLHDMPALKSLMVRGCNRLKALANMPPLESLEVKKCGSLEQLPHNMPALESLRMRYCGSLEQLPHHMPALNLLAVRDCGSLKQLPHHMLALRSLGVTNCGCLEQLPHHMPALEWLVVSWCGSLQQLREHMSDLKLLKVIGSNSLKALVNMPALESLKVYGCNWEGWPAGEATVTSMPCLREAEFENCPKTQTQGLIAELSGLTILTVRDCPSARLGWKLLEQMPNLLNLKLDSKSAVLVPSPLPPQVSTFLPSLKHLHLRDNMNGDEEVKWGRVPE